MLNRVVFVLGVLQVGVFVTLIALYPTTPAANETMVFLLTIWGAEMALAVGIPLMNWAPTCMTREKD